MYHVFLGAPSAAELKTDSKYHWEIISERPALSQPVASLRPVTPEAVSRRISRIYENIIFEDDEVSESQSEHDYSTLLSWPPTPPDPHSISRNEKSIPSFLVETQNTEESQSMTANYSDSSSIAQFPAFHFDLRSLTSLSSLQGQKGSRKVAMILSVLEVDGPDTIRLKKGLDAGKQIYILKLILGDEQGLVCKLTAWRDTAQSWGGLGDEIGLKRGDVVLLQNVTASYDAQTSTALSASPFLHSKCEICFRTMPHTSEDMKLRSDLRLGYSDPCVRRVAALVQWFEDMAGLKV